MVSDRNALPDRIWTLPNALSVLRLLSVPLFLWLLLGPQADGWAVVVLMVSGATDWADGKLARSLGQSSRLGALLDPAADRLYIVATLIAFVLRDVVPLWLVAVLVGRELVLGLALLVLRAHGYPPLQVHYLGKAATFILLYAFPLLLLADGDGPVDRKSTRLNSSHANISYAVFCLKKKTTTYTPASLTFPLFLLFQSVRIR